MFYCVYICEWNFWNSESREKKKKRKRELRDKHEREKNVKLYSRCRLAELAYAYISDKKPLITPPPKTSCTIQKKGYLLKL